MTAYDFLVDYFESRGLPLGDTPEQKRTVDYLTRGLIDSMGLVTLIMDVETHFGITLAAEHMLRAALQGEHPGGQPGELEPVGDDHGRGQEDLAVAVFGDVQVEHQARAEAQAQRQPGRRRPGGAEALAQGHLHGARGPGGAESEREVAVERERSQRVRRQRVFETQRELRPELRAGLIVRLALEAQAQGLGHVHDTDRHGGHEGVHAERGCEQARQQAEGDHWRTQASGRRGLGRASSQG